MESYERPHKNLERKRGIFFKLGMVISLLITFFAFEYRTASPRVEIDVYDEWENVPEEDMPVTFRKEQTEQLQPPPTPKPLLASTERVVIIPDDQIPVLVPTDSFKLSDIILIDDRKEPEPVDERPFNIAEINPEFPGGDEALTAYLKGNIRYPEAARKSGLDGIVYVTFVVDEQGRAIDIECKGISDKVFHQEARRVIENMPRWKPGQMGTRKVKVYMTIPVSFKLI